MLKKLFKVRYYLIVSTVLFAVISFSALGAWNTTVDTGDVLAADIWNEIVGKLIELDARPIATPHPHQHPTRLISTNLAESHGGGWNRSWACWNVGVTGPVYKIASYTVTTCRYEDHGWGTCSNCYAEVIPSNLYQIRICATGCSGGSDSYRVGMATNYETGVYAHVGTDMARMDW